MAVLRCPPAVPGRPPAGPGRAPVGSSGVSTSPGTSEAAVPAVTGGETGPGTRQRSGNGLATACLVAGIAGFTLVTIIPALLCGVLGLRRASRSSLRGPGAGQVRCWAGIGLAVVWAATGIYLAPRLVQAADPGCTAYKSAALTPYDRAISDLGGPGGNRSPASGRHGGSGKITLDLSQAITALSAAAARSHNVTTRRDLSRLTSQLRTVLTDVRDRAVVPATALIALNADATHADTACGTLHV